MEEMILLKPLTPRTSSLTVNKTILYSLLDAADFETAYFQQLCTLERKIAFWEVFPAT